MFKKRVIASFLLGALLGAGVVFFVITYFFTEPFTTAPIASTSIVASLPVGITIESVGIKASFGEPIGLDANGNVEVPKYYDRAAWYRLGPTPGEIGPAVILGHVDSESGPEVFHPLKDIDEGDLIEVTREDGSLAVFSVYEVDYYSQKNFPADAVFGTTNDAELRLVTCAGIFDKNEQRYSHNLVVYARLLELRSEVGV
jgi:hypothetical protein